MDQRGVEARKDVLVYSTAPLKRDVEAMGPVQVVLYVATSARDTDFTAKLVDVFPDGHARNLTDGILRLRYRKSLEKAELCEAGRGVPDHDRRGSDGERVPEGAPHPRGDLEQQLPSFRPQSERRQEGGGRGEVEPGEPDGVSRRGASLGAGAERIAGQGVSHNPSMPSENLIDMVVALAPEDQEAVRAFIDFLRTRGERPHGRFLDAADEFIAQHPEILRRLAQ